MVKLRDIATVRGTNNWMTANLPGQDGFDNDHMADVVGNKTDTVAGDSIIALAKQLAAAIVTIDAFHGVPTADVADNAVISDVVGNKSDTVAGTSIVALAKQLLAAIVTVDGLLDKPSADSSDNVVIRDVVGNKADTVSGDSLIALAKQLAAAIVTVDGLHDKPGTDSADNNQMRDVIGSKIDTVGGNSLVALIKQIVVATAVLKASKLFPTMADGILVTSSAAAWTLGAAATINFHYLDNAITLNPGEGEATRIPCTGHRFKVGDVVTIAGSALNDGEKTVTEISDADHFDFDDGTYNGETFAGTETAQVVIPSDFNIKYISIENLSANAVYEIVLYDDGGEIGRAVATKNAAQDGTVNVPIQTPIIDAGSKITAKAATNNAAGDTATIRIFYHTY